MSNVECIWPVGAELGEGTLWSPDERVIWFVDIIGCRLHCINPETGQRSTWTTPDRPGFVVLLSGDGILVGLADGLYRFDRQDGSFALLTHVGLELPENRLNDGAVGPDGRLWFGSKNESETGATGVWYRWSGTEPEPFDSGYIVTNGPAFSLDGRTLYYCDTTEGRILARSISGAGEVGENRLFARVDPSDGYPDGLAVDSEGCLWVALFAGAGVRRYSPDGELLQQIEVPCSNVTKPAFGGSDGRTLYLTTAHTTLSEKERAEQPCAGGLFAVRVDVPGLPPAVMALPDKT